MLTPPKKYLLAGFAGCGKTSLLKELQTLHPLDQGFDLDSVIRSEFENIEAMVEKLGWDAFREKEVKKLAELLQSEASMWVALGGGTLERGWSVIETFQNVRVIYVECDFETCWERIKNDPKARPLVRLGEEEMRRIYQSRIPLYERAHFKIKAQGSTQQLALALLHLVGLA